MYYVKFIMLSSLLLTKACYVVFVCVLITLIESIAYSTLIKIFSNYMRVFFMLDSIKHVQTRYFAISRLHL